MISGVIGAAITCILLSWLAGKARIQAQDHHGRSIIEYGTHVRALGWFVVGFAGLFVWALTRTAKVDLSAVIFGGGSFALAAMILFAEFHFVRIEFDDSAIYTFSPWRRRRTIPWSEIIEYGFSKQNQWHYLKSRKHGKIRMSVLLSGLGSVAAELEKRNIEGRTRRYRQPR